MKRNYWKFNISFIGIFFFVLFVNANDYAGSEKCFDCHKDQYNHWQASVHPWKLRKAEKVKYTGLPLPKGYSWEDISYVIGGAAKKARYIDQDGYIITAAKDGSKAKTQYNLQDGSWSDYFNGRKKAYKCGPCHMTAYNAKGHQDNKPGMIGTWKEDGVGCEECHGPGLDHIKNPIKDNVIMDSSLNGCAKCHQRGGINPKPPAKGGFIRHHEQANELLASPHKDLTCIECHDPHKRAVLVKDRCAECHKEKADQLTNTLHGKNGIECKECHMPKIVKSAIQVNKYTADVRTHIVKVNKDITASMFKTVEKGGKKYTYANSFITLDYVCLSCHSGRDIKWASENLKIIH